MALTFTIGALVLALDLIVVSGVFKSHATQSAKLAWILVVLLVPMIGMIACVLFGPNPSGSSDDLSGRSTP